MIWFARVRWQEHGKTRSRERRANNKTHARALADQLAAQLSLDGGGVLDAERLTFADLADEFERKKLIAATYAGNMKVSGMRSHQRQRSFLKPLREFFDGHLVQKINYEHLAEYRRQRFDTPTRFQRQRSVSHVNRELSLLRSIFTYALRCGYVRRSPFESGASLISLADEHRRDRILTPDEEMRLLAACTGRREHLRALVICAVDTGMRKGEILQLQWGDVDLVAGILTVRATTTKTRRPRRIGITTRLRAELERIKEHALPGDNTPVFGGAVDCKKAFNSACRAAGIEDLHFHDLRHTATTRMIAAGRPPAEVMKITGHSRWETFARYVNPDEDAARAVAAALDGAQRQL